MRRYLSVSCVLHNRFRFLLFYAFTEIYRNWRLPRSWQIDAASPDREERRRKTANTGNRVTIAADGFVGLHAGDIVYYFALYVIARHLLSYHLPGTRRNEDWNDRIGMATLRPKDGESPEKILRSPQISRVRTCDTDMTP